MKLRADGIRFVVGERRISQFVSGRSLQSILFDARKWTKPAAQAWLAREHFKRRPLTRSMSGAQLRYVHDARKFQPRSFQTFATQGKMEKVTMASNPKRAKKKSSAKKKRRGALRRGSGKVTRTNIKSVKVVKTNPKKRKKKRSRAKKRGVRKNARRGSGAAARYTVAMSAGDAKRFAQILKPATRDEMSRALQRHPRGGVYVALPSWHGTRTQADELKARIQLVLAYDAGRRRKSLRPAGNSIRVVAVP